ATSKMPAGGVYTAGNLFYTGRGKCPLAGMFFVEIAGAGGEVMVGAAAGEEGVTAKRKNRSDFMRKTLRRFVCVSCGHEFEMLHDRGQSGKQAKCPVCGGVVHRTDMDSTGPVAKKSRAAGRS
ncbi:MAG TPA: hypothetical protein DCM26_05915, partial [Desulfotomaculum sp.]|nr:hypothetical protein [Desulfotomaculum sp.]